MIFGLLAGAAALAECHERDSLQGHRVRANSWKSFRFRIWKLECANSSVSNFMNKLRHLESSSPPRCWDIFVHGGSLWWKWAQISETWPGWDCQWVANLPTRPIWPTWPIQPIQPIPVGRKNFPCDSDCARMHSGHWMCSVRRKSPRPSWATKDVLRIC